MSAPKRSSAGASSGDKEGLLTRRQLLKAGAAAGVGMLFLGWRGGKPVFAQIGGGSLDPGNVLKWQLPLVKPPAMPPTLSNKKKDMYKIAVRQFQQRILSPPHPETTVWSYGSTDYPGTVAEGGTFNYPAFTVEAKANKATQVLWRNQLADGMGVPLQHLLPVDPTLHWANPIGARDTRPGPADAAYWSHPYVQGPNGGYTGPVPMVTHVHGAHTYEDSDGYAEAWYLPAAAALDPNILWATGTLYDYFNMKYGHGWEPGDANFMYPNDQPATTLWYHDHTLGMTRLNVYAGPAGFWLIRGGPYDADLGYVAPGVGDDPLGEYTEIPIVIQDRSFNTDGSLFYPDNRAFFEGLDLGQLQIPFIPDPACGGPSDISPIWQPEFFGNMMVVNGFTWPFLEVEKDKRYRFRFLNGCNSRFLLLKMTTSPRGDNVSSNASELDFVQIGSDQGFLPAPVTLGSLLMGPAERADVIVDFSGFNPGDEIFLVNDGPDAPFGGISLEDISDFSSTGLVMKFIVVDRDNLPMGQLPETLPAAPLPGTANFTRKVSLNEEESETVLASEDDDGNVVLDCDNGEPFAPKAALCGTVNPDWTGNPLLWMDPITENPALGATEEWEIYNNTEDAHPIHVHLVHFEVVNREGVGGVRDPEAWETGYKDTVIAYPGEITRIKALYDVPGLYVWHCHIVEHEDNEMMRPYYVGPIPPDSPTQ